MSTVKKILYAAITLGMLIFFFYIIYSGFKKGDNDINRGFEQYSKASEDTKDPEKTYFDGKTVLGQEVIDAINKFKSDYVSIVVTNGKGTTSQYINISSVTSGVASIGSGTVTTISASQSSAANANYINPNGNFKGAVYDDANGSVVRIEFVQK